MIYYLSLGSNLGEREQTIREAVRLIGQQVGIVLRCSSFFYSEPWGFESAHPFCNLCCAVETSLNPMDVLRITQAIERTLGRTKKSTNEAELQTHPAYSDRTIDIDLIRVFDGQQELRVDTPDLTIPHKWWQQRHFVSIPLSEIISE